MAHVGIGVHPTIAWNNNPGTNWSPWYRLTTALQMLLLWLAPSPFNRRKLKDFPFKRLEADVNTWLMKRYVFFGGGDGTWTCQNAYNMEQGWFGGYDSKGWKVSGRFFGSNKKAAKSKGKVVELALWEMAMNHKFWAFFKLDNTNLWSVHSFPKACFWLDPTCFGYLCL